MRKKSMHYQELKDSIQQSLCNATGAASGSVLAQIVLDRLPQSIFWIDESGRIQGANAAFLKLIGHTTPDAIYGKKIIELPLPLHEKDLFTWCDTEVLLTGKDEHDTLSSLLRDDGSVVRFAVTKEPIRNAMGEIVGVIGYFQDITYQQRDDEAKKNASRLNRRLAELVSGFNMYGGRSLEDELTNVCSAALEELPIERVAIWQMSSDGTMLTARTLLDKNHKYENSVSLLRKYFHDIFNALGNARSLIVQDVRYSSDIASLLDAYLIPNNINAFMAVPVMMRGRVWGMVTVERVRYPYHWSKHESYFVQSMANIVALVASTDENILVRRELEEKNALYDLIMNATQDGVWDWNMLTDRVTLSHRWLEMLKYPQDKQDWSLQAVNQLVHPADFDNVFSEIARHQQEPSKPFDCTFRLRNNDGDYQWIYSRGKILRDAQGKPVRMVGTNTDIQVMKMAEEEIIQHREKLKLQVEQQTRHLVIAKEEAEHANRSKSEFLANMSHELRTPMHAIINYSLMCKDKLETAPKERLQKYLDNIFTSGERLLKLLNELLDLSKLEAGKMTFAFEEKNMENVVSHVLMEVRSLLEKKSLSIQQIHETDNLMAIADGQRMIQLVMNLVSNAIKFSPEGRTITIRYFDATCNDKPALGLSVMDEGVGIPEGELEAVFDKFTQSSRTKTGAGGTGLGLAICREIAEAHGGKIWAEHAPTGGGLFKILIPRERMTA